MEDIVRTLREHADSFNDDGYHDNPKAWPDLYREAADEIQRLRRQLFQALTPSEN